MLEKQHLERLRSTLNCCFFSISSRGPIVAGFREGILTGWGSDLCFSMRFLLAGLSAIFLFSSCSTLPRPGAEAGPTSPGDATALLRQSARAHGDPWMNYQRVDTAYAGEWSAIATRLQPVLTDPGFRKDSVETYRPRQQSVRQLHTGPDGTKEVRRTGRKIEVLNNRTRAGGDSEFLDAAALVADAYTGFLFGSSWLSVNGRELRVLQPRELDGESCQLVAGSLAPGFGAAAGDDFIAWIGTESRLLKRLQFSLNGLDSTRGADVDVVFSEHWKAADGSVWAGRFVEHIQRPVKAKAHEWRIMTLSLDGRKMR